LLGVFSVMAMSDFLLVVFSVMAKSVLLPLVA
jgi:hypothetical protein